KSIDTSARPASSTVTDRTMPRAVMGSKISGSFTAASASHTASSRAFGTRPSLRSCIGRLPLRVLRLELRQQRAQLRPNEFAVGQILHGKTQGNHLAGQKLRVGEIAFGALSILLDLHAIAVVLAVLRE